jgi:hypothetical protein
MRAFLFAGRRGAAKKYSPRRKPWESAIKKSPSGTNSVESLNRSLRKIIKTRQASKKWTMPIVHWREVLNHFTILWPERMPALERVAQ